MLNHNSKQQVKSFVAKNNFIPVMNNTKWKELFDLLNQVDDLISFRVTYVDQTTWPEPDSSFTYTSELAQIWGNFLAIEFIDISAQISHPQGALLKPVVVDHIDKIINICNSKSAKFSITDDGIRIYGYLRHGLDVNVHNYT
ncbi:hypothetical protein BTO10_02155 [Vibrio chagasii]|uniref:Uncharacterized protein n=1 Tax=Vibrio chagasii TaxID=170679 RepID=A0A2S7VN96_9VIBR|nr:DUF6678 family protein [Vibrio chagasii]PQJ63634.1 hypothetical protein BTO10_02110 [Vibrio chagasii]PQJ63640.1 hypothetical protein BTO10_02155 [Vibrio chagasii]